jgi:GT2 family glycosyltransferase
VSVIVSESDDRRAPLLTGPPDLSIVIVNWNSAEFVCRCVDSVRKNTTDLTYEILVVDNASFDGCDQILKNQFPEVLYLQSDKNLGFSKANNYAAQTAQGRSLLFLNPDTEIAGPALGRLYRALEELPGAGAVGARLLNADGSLQTSCIQSFPTILNQALDSEYFRKKWPGSFLWGTRPFLHDHGLPEEVEAICGACLMMKGEVFDKIGGFSEEYFMYAEDMDLCYRARKAGYKNYYVPAATVIHFGGSSSKKAPSNFATVMMRESIGLFIRKTGGNHCWIGYRFAMLLSAFCRLVLLSLSLFVQRLFHRPKLSNASFRKWWAIFRWSFRGGESTKPL